MKVIEIKACQRFGVFLLRHGKRYEGNNRWTQAHWHWLEHVRLDSPIQQIVMEEYIDAVKRAPRHVAGLEKQMEQALASWSLQLVVTASMAVCGVDLLSAMTILAEPGDDISRFDSPRQLTAYLGLVSSEHSSGGPRRQGGITKPVMAMSGACRWKRHGAIVFRCLKLNRHRCTDHGLVGTEALMRALPELGRHR